MTICTPTVVSAPETIVCPGAYSRLENLVPTPACGVSVLSSDDEIRPIV
jgi:hypothetical protein